MNLMCHAAAAALLQLENVPLQSELLTYHLGLTFVYIRSITLVRGHYLAPYLYDKHETLPSINLHIYSRKHQ